MSNSPDSSCGRRLRLFDRKLIRHDLFTQKANIMSFHSIKCALVYCFYPQVTPISANIYSVCQKSVYLEMNHSISLERDKTNKKWDNIIVYKRDLSKLHKMPNGSTILLYNLAFSN